jgi:glycosyltransferase involved in cell wall biosynthesis
VQKLSLKQPLVSVIIPTFNSGRFLEKCLSSLKKQTYERLEIVVVDDGSTDSTIGIAEKHGCRIIRTPKVGRVAAKNEGVKYSFGEYLFFVDSDMELAHNVVSECVNLAESNSHVGGVVIPERSVGNSFWVKVRDFERSFHAGSVVESARFFPTKLVKEVGGYDENLIFFEESTLPYKIQKKGYNVFARVNSVIFHHEENFSLITWLRKKSYYGKTIHVYRHKYRDYSRMQTSVEFRFYLFVKSYRRFLSRPELALGVIVLKSLEYLAVVSGARALVGMVAGELMKIVKGVICK